MWKRGWRGAVVLVVFGLLAWISHKEGVPSKLPGAALGWTLLFHLERAAAILATAGVVLLVGWRAMHGEFPIKFGQVEYAQKQAASAAALTQAQERRLRILEVLTTGTWMGCWTHSGTRRKVRRHGLT